MVTRKLGLLSFLSLTVALIPHTLHAQSITLSTQAEVDAFDPEITMVNGSLYITNSNSSDPITNLLPLAALEAVSGDLLISYCLITDLDGLDALSYVGDDLLIQNNKRLKSLDHLNSLTTVGGIMEIHAHDSLTSISGVEALTSIGEELRIRYNKMLQSINGFNQVSQVGGDIIIFENSLLSEINGFNNIVTTDLGLVMENNASLSTITGFQNMTEVKGDLSLIGSNMSQLDFLAKVEEIGGNLSIENNNDLVGIPDLNMLKHVGGLGINSNTSLTDIAGFNGLVSVSNVLEIFANSITQITGFGNLKSVGGLMHFSSNNALTDIFGFSALESAGGMTFIVNPALVNFEGFAQLKSITSSLQFTSDDAIKNMDDFQGVTSIGSLHFTGCQNLINTDGFSNLTSLGALDASSCPRLERIKLPRIRRIPNDLRVSGVPLKTLELPLLDSIGSELSINNTALEDVNGLSKLEEVGYSMSITRNEMLVHLNGFRNLRSVGGSFEISRNTILSDCCGIRQLLDSPDAIGQSTSIFSNNTGCDSKPEVLANGKCVNVINDINGDCIWNAGEPTLSGRFAILTPGNIFLTTNSIGQFDLRNLEVGQYTLQIDTSGPWTTSCSDIRTFDILQGGDLPEFEPFELHADDPCTVPTLSVQMPFVRRCFGDQGIVIQVCNGVLATGALEDAFVVLMLDSLFTFQSSSVPATNIGPNLYRFKIEDLKPGECMTIKIKVEVSCNAVIGQSLCLRAELAPVDTCVFTNEVNTLTDTISGCAASYQGSKIAISGYCEHDSVYFSVENLADIATECYVPLRLFRDESLVWKDSILLGAHSNHTMSFFGDGRTMRLEADQHPDYPGLSRPNISIERCGDLSNWTPGIRNAFYEDDLSPIVDISCNEVRGSFDPNNKTAAPGGLGDLHYILPNEPLDYTILFQNTGNDTAFTVVIRDTLDMDLDIFSVKPGASSHPYQFIMHGPRVLEWEFDNILLPDSNVNEARSHGFLTFQVKQNIDLVEGTVLSNRAGIYFDFNEPILTNEVTQVINGLDELISSTKPDQFLAETTGRVVPNPSSGLFDIVFDEVKPDIQIQLFNGMGQLIYKGQFTNTNAIHLTSAKPPGLYFIHVFIPGEKKFVLKAIVK